MKNIRTELITTGKCYIEGNPTYGSRRLKNDIYAQATASLICVCTDIQIINTQKKVFYLVQRKVDPMKHWWRIGGRRMPGETIEESAQRSFARETLLDVECSRFLFVTTQECIWSNRKEKPKKIAKHEVIYVFTIELSDKERRHVSLHLDQHEYEPTGLHVFNHERMIQENVHPSIRDIYSTIFPSSSSVVK